MALKMKRLKIPEPQASLTTGMLLPQSARSVASSASSASLSSWAAGRGEAVEADAVFDSYSELGQSSGLSDSAGLSFIGISGGATTMSSAHVYRSRRARLARTCPVVRAPLALKSPPLVFYRSRRALLARPCPVGCAPLALKSPIAADDTGRLSATAPQRHRPRRRFLPHPRRGAPAAGI